ncbi:MAG: hypothetical protein CFE32_14375 [Alphaproteobacteria bacterium PA3]|nr:MAG: hypothetical protein CFE32_14375 [Alphaproteobacteria bacterium PA3]
MNPHPRLELPQITLVAVTSVNVAATVIALERSMAQIAFGAVRLIADHAPEDLPSGVEWVPIAPLASASAYSSFILERLADHIATSHCLLVQWDGHIIHPQRWRPEFLDQDYIGAAWPQFDDGHDVGNGGFSLRSRALLEACRAPGFHPSHPEDLAIGRANRAWLESQGLRFAPPALADAFSSERQGDPTVSFGFHGIWHMPRLLGRDAFWRIYSNLDERTSARHDFRSLLWQVARGRGGIGRAMTLIRDHYVHCPA